jgi:hypothetical protein
MLSQREAIPPVHGKQVEMYQGDLLDEELRDCQWSERRAEFQIALTGITGGNTLLVFFAFDLEVAKHMKIPSSAERTEEALHFPGAGTETAP